MYIYAALQIVNIYSYLDNIWVDTSSVHIFSIAQHYVCLTGEKSDDLLHLFLKPNLQYSVSFINDKALKVPV